MWGMFGVGLSWAGWSVGAAGLSEGRTRRAWVSGSPCCLLARFWWRHVRCFCCVRACAEPSVRLAVYRRNKDSSQGVKLYKELVVAESKRRTWGDVLEVVKVRARVCAHVLRLCRCLHVCLVAVPPPSPDSRACCVCVLFLCGLVHPTRP